MITLASRTTLARFLAEDGRRAGPGRPEIASLVLELASGFREISALLARGRLAGALGDAGRENAHGERQERMDVLANEILVRACERSGRVAAIVSEEMDDPYLVVAPAEGADLLVAFDPLDGSSNLDVNVTVGTIFSILRRPAGAGSGAVSPEEFLQRATQQLCAGYALYGPSTMLVLATGGGVDAFTLDPSAGELVLTHPGLRIPANGREFAINASNERFWEPPVRRYVDECVAGRSGPRAVDFNMRWVGSTVADAHRVLLRGGVFLHPRDSRIPARPGKLRLLYEAAPLALVAERAGGLASTGRTSILEVQPESLHQRVPVLLGSRREIERLVRFHTAPERVEDPPYTSPLFNERSLLRGR